MKLTRLTSALAAAGMTSALLMACGGGGSDTPAPAASVKLEGVAALGRAFAGAAVSVTDGTNTVNAAKPVGADGKYSVDVSSLKAPLIVTATGAVGDNTVTLRSVVATRPWPNRPMWTSATTPSRCARWSRPCPPTAW